MTLFRRGVVKFFFSLTTANDSSWNGEMDKVGFNANVVVVAWWCSNSLNKIMMRLTHFSLRASAPKIPRSHSQIIKNSRHIQPLLDGSRHLFPSSNKVFYAPEFPFFSSLSTISAFIALSSWAWAFTVLSFLMKHVAIFYERRRTVINVENTTRRVKSGIMKKKRSEK